MGSYRVSRLALLALAVVALGGCARDVTSPGATTAPRFSAAGGSTRYLVLFKANAVPADFGARVQALGGTVTFSHPVGLAVVSGLNGANAATLGTDKDIASMASDVGFGLDDPMRTREPAPAALVNSVANPAGALLYSRQWNMRQIKANQAWAAGRLGSADVTVAILDTGIDYDSYDLNGLVDLARSVSFIPSDDSLTATYFPARNLINDYHGHGTNVATQVSSKAYAFAGVTSKTTLMGVKVLGANGRSFESSVLAGVLYAADHGADVANMSLGGGFWKMGRGRDLAMINRVIGYAKQKGMLIVVAAGNSALNLDQTGNLLITYCDAPHVVCVSSVGPATDADVGTPAADAFAFYSNYGRSAIAVAGPGGNATLDEEGNILYASWVWSMCAKQTLAGFTAAGVPILAGCQSGGYITAYIGTSQATPHVSGLAAQLIASMGKGNPSAIKAAILKSADDLGQPGVDPYYGAGRINVAKALGL